MVSLTHVSKIFDGKRKATALEDIDLHIDKGHMVSIVGPSGSGKSTLLNLIGGLDRPTSGDIRIDGENLSELSDDDLTRVRRDKIGFVFQFFNLLPTLNCLENVALPLHLRKWPRRKIEDRAKELLNLVQLGHRLEHLPDEICGGTCCDGFLRSPASSSALAFSWRCTPPTGRSSARSIPPSIALPERHSYRFQPANSVLMNRFLNACNRCLKSGSLFRSSRLLSTRTFLDKAAFSFSGST